MAKTTIQITKKIGKLGSNTWTIDGTSYSYGTGVPLAGLTDPAETFEVESCGNRLAPGRVWTVETAGGHWLECLWESDGFFSWWLDGEVVAVNNMGVQNVLLPPEYYASLVDVPGGAAGSANYVIKVIHS